MFHVKFINWEQDREAVPLCTWFRVTHWVHLGEQVWLYGTRYEVVRVEHLSTQEVSCFVKEMT